MKIFPVLIVPGARKPPKTRSMLEEHYYEIHHVVLQPSCCAPPSVFQTIMGKELRLRQGNIGSYSTGRAFLRDKMTYDDAKEILGATCAVQEDKAKVWYVKMPEFIQLGDTSLVSPELRILDEDESYLNEYMLDPLIQLCAYQTRMTLSTGP